MFFIKQDNSGRKKLELCSNMGGDYTTYHTDNRRFGDMDFMKDINSQHKKWSY